MLKPISPDEARRLREFLLEAGFEDKNLRKQGYFMELPSSRLRNTPRLLDSLREPTMLHVLLRWFWLGVPQDRAASVTLFPSWFVDLTVSCGLLQTNGNEITSDLMLFPVNNFLAVCDRPVKIEQQDPEFVLWPNPTTRLLSHFTIRGHSGATLDLGTGNAIQALSAAAHSDQVVGTDLNPRAIDYAKFTARLNGIEDIEWLVGDGFTPVAGRKFDLIVSNPPFFISPSDRYMFCDNPEDLDQLCRRFVKEAPAYLEEGGYFQLLCEWAQIKGQTWQERVSEWLEGTGCDAWVVKGNTQGTAEYAQHRISESTPGMDRDAELFANYMAYYRSRNVEAIHDGIIALRKRSGKNWVQLEEMNEIPNSPFGESILSVFNSRDFLDAHASDEQMLNVKPRLSPNARLEQFFQPGEGRWQPTTLNLRLTKGFPFFIGLQPEVAGFLSACDGSKSIGELVGSFARQVDAPFEKVQSECLNIMRRLLDRGFLLV